MNCFLFKKFAKPCIYACKNMLEVKEQIAWEPLIRCWSTKGRRRPRPIQSARERHFSSFPSSCLPTPSFLSLLSKDRNKSQPPPPPPLHPLPSFGIILRLNASDIRVRHTNWPQTKPHSFAVHLNHWSDVCSAANLCVRLIYRKHLAGLNNHRREENKNIGRGSFHPSFLSLRSHLGHIFITQDAPLLREKALIRAPYISAPRTYPPYEEFLSLVGEQQNFIC